MTPADLQNPERGSAPVEDPAVVAGKEAQEAAAAFNAIAAKGDETSPEWVAAEKRTTEADAIFADAPVTSAAGALVKMREIAEMGMTGQYDDEGLEGRHFKTVVAFLEGFTGAPFVVADDPAVVAFAELTAAWAAFEVCSEKEDDSRPGPESPEYVAAYERYAAARGVVRDAVPVSLAGVAGKVRAMLEPYRADADAVGLDQDYDLSAKAMLPFLEGAPPPAPKPDPVVALFAKWAIDRDEATALGDSDPECKDDKINTRLEAAWARTDALEDKIMKTPATTMRGVAIKIRIVSHYIFDSGDFDKRYATPARDIDYVEGAGGKLGADESYVVSALRDAERLAGVS